MFSPVVSKATPTRIEVPDTVATDDDEGNTGANSLLAEEAIRMQGSSQRSTADSHTPVSSWLGRIGQDGVLALPDSHDEQAAAASDLGVDTQPLLDWLQSGSQAQRLPRRQSELNLVPERLSSSLHRSVSEAADADADAKSNPAATVSSNAPQLFYGYEPRRALRRDPSSQLLNNMQRSMHAPYRQRSLLSRASASLSDGNRLLHDHESANSFPHTKEMIEMTSNPLSRIASDGPESSSGSVLVEVSPDSYEPLHSVIWGTPGMLNQMPMTVEEEAEVGLLACYLLLACICLHVLC